MATRFRNLSRADSVIGHLASFLLDSWKLLFDHISLMQIRERRIFSDSRFGRVPFNIYESYYLFVREVVGYGCIQTLWSNRF